MGWRFDEDCLGGAWGVRKGKWKEGRGGERGSGCVMGRSSRTGGVDVGFGDRWNVWFGGAVVLMFGFGMVLLGGKG